MLFILSVNILFSTLKNIRLICSYWSIIVFVFEQRTITEIKARTWIHFKDTRVCCYMSVLPTFDPFKNTFRRQNKTKKRIFQFLIAESFRNLSYAQSVWWKIFNDLFNLLMQFMSTCNLTYLTAEIDDTLVFFNIVGTTSRVRHNLTTNVLIYIKYHHILLGYFYYTCKSSFENRRKNVKINTKWKYDLIVRKRIKTLIDFFIANIIDYYWEKVMRRDLKLIICDH
jgi:hypothetical protein